MLQLINITGKGSDLHPSEEVLSMMQEKILAFPLWNPEREDPESKSWLSHIEQNIHELPQVRNI